MEHKKTVRDGYSAIAVQYLKARAKKSADILLLGVALLCLGVEDLPDDIEEDFHGQGMYWSHYDAATYQSMLKEIGFSILLSKIVPDETYDGKHLFVFSQKENLLK